LIQHLLSQITAQLQAELVDQIPQPNEHILSVPIRETPLEKLPLIGIYPGKLSISTIIKEPNHRQKNNGQSATILTAIREFQQEFFVDIYGGNLVNLEKLNSLILGIILINIDALIEDFNSNNVTQYQSKQILTNHSLSHLQPLEANYTTLTIPFKLQSKFQVTGQLKSTKTISESLLPIEKIEIREQVIGNK
jgi:hypothetical protein